MKIFPCPETSKKGRRVIQTFRRHQVKKKVILAECQTFVYAVDSRGPAHVEIMKVKNRVRASALPETDTAKLMDVVGEVYPEYAAATNVLETSINNTGAFGVPVFDVREWYKECHDVEGESLYEVLRNNPHHPLGFSGARERPVGSPRPG